MKNNLELGMLKAGLFGSSASKRPRVFYGPRVDRELAKAAFGDSARPLSGATNANTKEEPGDGPVVILYDIHAGSRLDLSHVPVPDHVRRAIADHPILRSADSCDPRTTWMKIREGDVSVFVFVMNGPRGGKFWATMMNHYRTAYQYRKELATWKFPA